MSSLSKRRKAYDRSLRTLLSVSYTHLTLPTKLEV